MGRATGEVVSRGCGVASETDVVWAVLFEVGATATGVAGQDSGVGTTTGGVSKWGWDRGRRGGCAAGFVSGGGGEVGRSTLHKGSSDPGSKSRKAADGGILDIKGRSAGVVT